MASKSASVSPVMSGSTGQSRGTDASTRCYECIELISFLAILAIGITALAASLSGHETMILGWTVAGVAVLAGVVEGRGESNLGVIFTIFVMGIVALLGVLGGTGVLDATQLGWGIVGTGITIVGLACCLASCYACGRMMNPT